jgi:hypothetical protein
MGPMAERGAQRMQARQTYRTMARMQRRRSFVQSRVGIAPAVGVSKTLPFHDPVETAFLETPLADLLRTP